MANTRSAKKMVRKIARRTQVNRLWRSRLRTATRKFEDALTASDSEATLEAFRNVQAHLARAAQKGILHKNTAARKTSRLYARMSH